jgi:hypothetical protein
MTSVIVDVAAVSIATGFDKLSNPTTTTHEVKHIDTSAAPVSSAVVTAVAAALAPSSGLSEVTVTMITERIRIAATKSNAKKAVAKAKKAAGKGAKRKRKADEDEDEDEDDMDDD